MKSRSRKSGKHRGRGLETTAPVPMPALDLTTEIVQTIEARDRLSAALARFDSLHEQARQKFLRNLAVDLQAGEINAERVAEKAVAWKNEEMRGDAQKAALQQFRDLLTLRYEAFKLSAEAETIAALKAILKRLGEEFLQSGADQDAVSARQRLLGEDLKALEVVLPPASPRDPKEKDPLPPRSAKATAREKKASRKAKK